MTDDTKTGLSRRTLAKGAAWSVPAVAVAAAAPAYAASIKPPVINFGGACGNTGATQKGCGGEKTLQVPLTLTNHTGSNIVFQITSMYTCNCSTAPTGPGTGVSSGVRGVWATPSHAVSNHSHCSAPTGSTCGGGVIASVGTANVTVPNGTSNATYWIESVPLGDSSSFSTTINWRLIDASTCKELETGVAKTAAAIAPQNCGSDKAILSSEPEPTVDAAAEPEEQAKSTQSQSVQPSTGDDAGTTGAQEMEPEAVAEPTVTPPEETPAPASTGDASSDA